MIAIPEYASAAAVRGWHVFPVLPGDKRPAVDKWEQRASSDPEGVRKAFGRRYYGHNIGLACGPSNLLVIDLDVHGHLPDDWRGEPDARDGSDVLATLAERAGQGWPTTWMVRTPSGGWHMYYQMPDGQQIRNSAGKLGPMIDVRGHGGYVVGAGSVTDAGIYETLSDPDEPVEPLPTWLLALLSTPVEFTVPDVPTTQIGGLHSPRYAQAALEDELAKVASATEGTRNDTLNIAALSLGQLCAAGLLDEGEVSLMLCDVAQYAGLPITEIRATIRSGMRAGAANPRSVL